MWYSPCDHYDKCKNYQHNCLNCSRNVLVQDHFEHKDFLPTEFYTSSTTPKMITYRINSFEIEDKIDSFNISDFVIKSATPRAIKVTSEQWKLVQAHVGNDLVCDSNMEYRLYGVPIYIDDTIDGDYKLIW